MPLSSCASEFYNSCLSRGIHEINLEDWNGLEEWSSHKELECWSFFKWKLYALRSQDFGFSPLTLFLKQD